MPRRRPSELNVNHERWLVSYADFITLLFAFFVVMYSISQVSESKYRVLSETLTEAFEPTRSVRPLQVGQPSRSPSSSAIDIRGDERGDTTNPQLGESASVDALDELGDLGELGELAQRINDRFSDLIGEDLLEVYANEHWLKVELKDSILFESASAEPSGQARDIFQEMALLLSEYQSPVQVEGHTDNRPIQNVQYPSNWELSAARASAIVKLLAASGVSAARLSAVGYGEYQPVADNDTPEGQAKNRRVALMIAREAMNRPTTPLSETGWLGATGNTQEVPGTSQASSEAAAQAPVPQASVSQESLSQADNGVSTSDAPEEAPDADQSREVEQKVIEPVQLEGGGLLFSSDPELPRQRRVAPQQNAPEP